MLAVPLLCLPHAGLESLTRFLYEINNHMTTQNEEYEELRNLKFYHNVYR